MLLLFCLVLGALSHGAQTIYEWHMAEHKAAAASAGDLVAGAAPSLWCLAPASLLHERGLSFLNILWNARQLRNTQAQDFFPQSLFPWFILERCGRELVHVPSKAVPMSQDYFDFG